MVEINQSKCIGCGECVKDCVAGNIKLQNGKAVYTGPCILCGHCVAVCTQGAAAIPEYDMTDVETFDKDLFGFNIKVLLHTIKLRRSIRRYKGRTVEKEKLEYMIQAGRYTATGSNRQACRFVTVSEGLQKFKEIVWKGISEAAENPKDLSERTLSSYKRFLSLRERGTDYLFRNAPALMYIAAESPVDAALAAQNMELAAIAMGLGVLYNGYLVYAANSNTDALKWLDLEDKPCAVCMLIGYPDVTYMRSAPRKPADTRWL